MAFLKKGTWCLYKGERLCRVSARQTREDIYGVYWADVEAGGFVDIKDLTPLPEGLNQILSDSIKKGE
jgi:hypothetical protein